MSQSSNSTSVLSILYRNVHIRNNIIGMLLANQGAVIATFFFFMWASLVSFLGDNDKEHALQFLPVSSSSADSVLDLDSKSLSSYPKSRRPLVDVLLA